MAETDQPIIDKELDHSPDSTTTNLSDFDEVNPVQENTLKTREKSSDNFLACLQVLGAFFCMFNSW
jgi:hypothetical protein